MTDRVPLLERFFAKVDRNGPVPGHRPELGACWLWTGAKVKGGYGHLKVHGVVVYAHRLAWRLAHRRPPPLDREVAHHCDVRACVRPSHLFVATHDENMKDAARKGRCRNQHSSAAA